MDGKEFLKLWDLISSFRKESEDYKKRISTPDFSGKAMAFDEAANKLEKLLRDLNT